MKPCFLSSQWKEVRNGKDNSTVFHFLYSQHLKKCLSDGNKVYSVPSSSLWSGIPALTSEQLLLPGTDINSLSRGNQIVCFTEHSSGTSCTQDVVELNADRSDDCMIVEPNERTTLRHVGNANTMVTPMGTKNDLLAKLTTVDSGYHASTTSPVLICGSSVDSVEETDDEECILEICKSPLPGLSSMRHRLSQLADSANALSSQPSTIEYCSPVISNQSSSGVLSLVCSREAPLGDERTPSPPQLLDLTLDEGIVIDESCDSSDDVVIVKVVEGKGGVKREGGAALVLTNQVAVVTCCGIVLTQADLDTLKPSQWLNDQVINAFMKLLMKFYNPPPSAKGSKVRVHATSTFFYTKLRSAGYAGVERWLRKVDMHRLRLLLVPVHLGCHWCLAAVDFRNKSIAYFDSMGGKNISCLKRLKRFLVRCGLEKRTRHVKHWRVYFPENVPRQNNISDCGVFACQFARWLCSTKLRPSSKSYSGKIPFSHKHMYQFRLLMIKQLKYEQLHPTLL